MAMNHDIIVLELRCWWEFLRGCDIFLQQGSLVVERKPWITIIWLNMIAIFLISLDQYYSPQKNFKGLTRPQTIFKSSNMLQYVFIDLLLLNIWEIATMFVNSSVYVSSIEMVPKCWRNFLFSLQFLHDETPRRSSSSAEPYGHQRWFLDMRGGPGNHINNAWLWLIMVNYG